MLPFFRTVANVCLFLAGGLVEFETYDSAALITRCVDHIPVLAAVYNRASLLPDPHLANRHEPLSVEEITRLGAAVLPRRDVVVLEDLERKRRRQVLVQVIRRRNVVVVDEAVRVVCQAVEENLPREVFVVEVAIGVEHPDTDDAHAQRQSKGTERHVRVLVAGELVELVANLVRDELTDVLDLFISKLWVLFKEFFLVFLLGFLLELLQRLLLITDFKVLVALQMLDLDELLLLRQDILPVPDRTNQKQHSSLVSLNLKILG